MAPHDHAHGSPFAPSDSPGWTPDTQLPNTRGKIVVTFVFTATILLAQTIGVVLTGSPALLAGTVHMVIGASGLLVVLVAATFTRRPPSSKRTWGYRRAEVLVALAQAATLAGVGVYVIVEAVGWLRKPPDMPSKTLIVFDVIDLLSNAASMLALVSARRSSLNIRAVFLEVTNDALGSLNVIVAAIVIATTGWQRANTVAGLFVAALILPRVVKLIGKAEAVPMETTSRGLDLGEVRRHMLSLDHVLSVRDLHASTATTGLPVISAHVVVGDDCFQDGCTVAIFEDLRTCVAEHFDVAIHHSTFQLETRSASQRESGIHACGYAGAASRNAAYTPDGS